MSSTSKAYSYTNYNVDDIEEFNNEMKDNYEVLLDILSQFETYRINGEDLLTNLQKFSKSKPKTDDAATLNNDEATPSKKRKLSASKKIDSAECETKKKKHFQSGNSSTESDPLGHGNNGANSESEVDSAMYDEKYMGQIHTLISNTDEEITSILKCLKLIQHIQGIRAKRCIEKGMSKKSIMMETIDESAKILPLWIKGLPESSEEEDNSAEVANRTSSQEAAADDEDNKERGSSGKNKKNKKSSKKKKKKKGTPTKGRKRSHSKQSVDSECNGDSDDSFDLNVTDICSQNRKTSQSDRSEADGQSKEENPSEMWKLRKKRKSQNSVLEDVPPLCGAEPPSLDYIAKSGDGVAAFVGEDWILAEVKCFNESRGKYEIDDIYEKQIHILEKENVIPLPLYRANPRENPEAIFQTGTIVLALYNTTTCFYKAVVTQAPENPEDPYLVLFEDHESNTKYQDEPKEVFQRYILNYHDGMPYGHIADEV